MNETTIWVLPCRSQDIVEGPEAVLGPGSLQIRYDTEEEGIRQLAFVGVLGMMFTESNACGTDHLRAYDKLLELQSSELLEQLRARSHAGVGDVHHYRIFFDDVGCYDVVAKSFEG